MIINMKNKQHMKFLALIFAMDVNITVGQAQKVWEIFNES